MFLASSYRPIGSAMIEREPARKRVIFDTSVSPLSAALLFNFLEGIFWTLAALLLATVSSFKLPAPDSIPSQISKVRFSSFEKQLFFFFFHWISK